jgi:glutamate 5-kinase
MKPSASKAGGRRWVIKIGSALLTDQGRGLDQAAIQLWVDQMAALRKAGIDVVLVSSGSIAEGMSRLGLERRPQAVYQLQGLAAVGQMGLIQVYESFFQNHDTHTAQILMTREDFANRARYLNARSTLRCLLGWGVVPVVNENDSVATDEFRLGDNDTLAGLVANLVEAELLVVISRSWPWPARAAPMAAAACVPSSRPRSWRRAPVPPRASCWGARKAC